MAIAETLTVFDGRPYYPGETIPDFGTIENAGTVKEPVYRGAAGDFSKLEAVTTTSEKYADLPTGAMFVSSDFDTIKSYQRVNRAWTDMA